MGKKKYDVFLSYRRDGGQVLARAVYGELMHRGLRCFLDFEGIEKGNFDTVIRAAIENCTFFVPILTPNALDGEWVRKEIAFALETKKNPSEIVPLHPFDPLHKDYNPTPFPDPMPKDVEKLCMYNCLDLDLGRGFSSSMTKIADALSTETTKLRRRMPLMIVLACVFGAAGVALFGFLEVKIVRAEINAAKQELSHAQEESRQAKAEAEAALQASERMKKQADDSMVKAREEVAAVKLARATAEQAAKDLKRETERVKAEAEASVAKANKAKLESEAEAKHAAEEKSAALRAQAIAKLQTENAKKSLAEAESKLQVAQKSLAAANRKSAEAEKAASRAKLDQAMAETKYNDLMRKIESAKKELEEHQANLHRIENL